MEIALRHETAEAIRVKPPAAAQAIESCEAGEVAELLEAAQ
jgi:hypothetical protein